MILLLALACLGPLVQRSMTPAEPFAGQAPPLAPDYARPEAWSALPERQDAGDAVPSGETPIDQMSAPVAVFYVHPTSYVGDRWNGPVDDPALNAATDEVATGIQATAFNACCAVWAPRYRQANGSAFFNPRPEGDAAIDLAYGDVKRAFAVFDAHRGERPFILAGHSQGSLLAMRLLVEEVSGDPLREKLVYAVLPGWPHARAGLAEAAPDIPPCAGPESLGCVVSWNARGPDFEAGSFEPRARDAREPICTNPLSWLDGGGPMPATANLGAVFLETEDHGLRPGFADASCEAGRLVVRELQRAPRTLPSRILDRVLGEGNYHPIEVQIFFANLRQNALARVKAMLATPG